MKPLSRNVLSLTAADIMGRFLGFLVIAYLARTLGPSGMGILAISAAILAYGTILADAGLPILGTRWVAAGGKDPRLLVKQIWPSRLFLSIITVVLGAGILFLGVKDNTIRIVAVIYLVSLIPSAMVLDWLFQGLRSMTILAVGRVLGMGIYLIFVLSTVSKPSHLWLVPVGWIMGAFGQALYLWSSFRRIPHGTERLLQPGPSMLDTIRMGIPLGVATLISQVVIHYPFIHMGLFDTAGTTGIYSVAFRVVVLFLIVDRVFYTVFFPAISQSFKHGFDQLARKFDDTLKIVSAGALYVGTLSILASRSLFPWIFGPEFSDCSLIFQMLVVYFVLTVINSTFTFTLIGAEKEKVYTRSLLVGAVGFFAVMFLPIPISTLLRAPVALAVFQTLSLLVMSKELQTLIPVTLFRRIAIPILSASVLILLFTKWEKVSPLFAFLTALVISFPILAIASGVNGRNLRDLKRTIL